jgi:formylglycine-generating enzyme required for sulfatase activity
VYRGGSWYDDAQYARVPYRFAGTPGFRYSYLGFRLASSSK